MKGRNQGCFRRDIAEVKPGTGLDPGHAQHVLSRHWRGLACDATLSHRGDGSNKSAGYASPASRRAKALASAWPPPTESPTNTAVHGSLGAQRLLSSQHIFQRSGVGMLGREVAVEGERGHPGESGQGAGERSVRGGRSNAVGTTMQGEQDARLNGLTGSASRPFITRSGQKRLQMRRQRGIMVVKAIAANQRR